MTDPVDLAGLVRVDVLTGFLGSGKTTLVRRLFERGALADAAILVNEFAVMPVDQDLIELSGAKATLVGDRCLCCVADGNLRAALIGMIEGRSDGSLPPFTRILVETSGLADPTALLAALASDPMLRPRFRAGRVVTLVDLCHGLTTLEESEEAMAQVLVADILLLTKADLVAPDAGHRLAERLTALNPIARIIADAEDPFDRRALPDALVAPPPIRRFQAAPTGTQHGRIAAAVITADTPLEWARFAAWLSLLLHRHGASILRIKGKVGIGAEGRPTTVMIQSVRHVVHQPEHLPAVEADGSTALVVIARDIAPERLLRSFHRHVVGASAREQTRAIG